MNQAAQDNNKNASNNNQMTQSMMSMDLVIAQLRSKVVPSKGIDNVEGDGKVHVC